MANVVAIIPARSGSRSIKDKNIRIMNGKPLLAYSIEQALASKGIDRVIVSTDSPTYQSIALEYGAEAPFLRPQSISQDASLDIDVFQHVLNWLECYEGYQADICVHLRPTHPIRKISDIDNMIQMLQKNPGIDSVRSVSPVKQTPYKMWEFVGDDSNMIRPFAVCNIPEAYNAPRQILPKIYMQNACVDVIRGDTIRIKRSMTGEKIAGYKMDYNFDIDTEEEFLQAEKVQLLMQSMVQNKKLKICFDIDGVIASKTANNDYAKAMPLHKNIDIINALHREGHNITLFTARGYSTSIDWRKITKQQMECWNVQYDELKYGKPDADFYIDDKSLDLELLKLIIQEDTKR